MAWDGKQEQQQLGGLLTDLMDVRVSLAPGTHNRDQILPRAFISLYRGDGGQVVAACACDVELANYAGAALTRIPKGTAQDSIKRSALEDEIVNNYLEIMNVLSRWINETWKIHVVLAETGKTAGEVPADLKSRPAFADAKLWLHLNGEIAGYGGGRMSIVNAQ